MDMNPKKTTIDDVLLYSLREYYDNGFLVPITGKIDVPFNIKRVFYVGGVTSGASRGKHAHKECDQVLICMNGAIEVECYDGTNKRHITLDKTNMALYIPTGIWSEEIYRDGTTRLMVLCNYVYDPKEYIKDLDEFLEWKKRK